MRGSTTIDTHMRRVVYIGFPFETFSPSTHARSSRYSELKMVLDIYLDPCTVNSRKVLAGLDLMGTKYEFHHIDFFKGEQKGDVYMKINHSATVPALKDGDLLLTESNSILLYAAELGKSEYYPSDIKKRADVNRWLFWESSVWFPSCYIYLVENVVKPLLKDEPDKSILDAQDERFHQLATILEATLSKNKWLVGDELTIADLSVAAPMHLHAAQKLPLDKYPSLRRWIAEVEKLPSWQKTQGAVDKALLPNGAQATNGPSNKGSVETTVNYTKHIPNKACELYFYESEKAKDIHEPGDDAQKVSVHDGWHRANDFSVDKEGFALGELKTDYENWEDEQSVRKSFYPEVVEFLKQTVGAKRVLVFDHTIRTKANIIKKLTQETNTSQRAPVKLVHCDYTAESGPVRLAQLLPEEADALMKSRVAFINVWKPIHNVVEENPLAMCEVPSAPNDDFFKLFLRYRDRNGENYVMRYNQQHRWWYFPNMDTDKVILLKTYDSETDGRARFVGHTAFDDPTSPPDAKTRESVEIRTIAFF